jgi:K+-transporting ATPase ATPase C chain
MNTVADIQSIPKEMIFASGSGLDPQISPESALMQVDRIVRERHLDYQQKETLLASIKALTQEPQFMSLGERRINVLNLNMALDDIALSKTEKLGESIKNK